MSKKSEINERTGKQKPKMKAKTANDTRNPVNEDVVTRTLNHPNLPGLPIHDFPIGDEYVREHDSSWMPQEWNDIVRRYDEALIPTIFSRPEKEYEKLDWEVAQRSIVKMLSSPIQIFRQRRSNNVVEKHVIRLKEGDPLMLSVDPFVTHGKGSEQPMTYRIARENMQSIIGRWTGMYEYVLEECTSTGEVLQTTVLEERSIALVKEFPIIPRLMNVLTDEHGGLSSDCREPHMVLNGIAKNVLLVIEGKLSGNVRTEHDDDGLVRTLLFLRRQMDDFTSRDYYMTVQSRPRESATVSIGPLKDVPLAILLKAMEAYHDFTSDDLTSDDEMLVAATGRLPSRKVRRVFEPTRQRLYTSHRDFFYMKTGKSTRMRKAADILTSDQALDAIVALDNGFFNQANYGCPPGLNEGEWCRDKVRHRLQRPVSMESDGSSMSNQHSFLAFLRVLHHHFDVLLGDALPSRRDTTTNIELRGIGRFLLELCVMDVKEKIKFASKRVREKGGRVTQLLKDIDVRDSVVLKYLNKSDASYTEAHSKHHNANRSGDWYKVTRRDKLVSEIVRNDDPENIGFLDSAGTTDGAKVGLILHLTAGAQVSIALSADYVSEQINLVNDENIFSRFNHEASDSGTVDLYHALIFEREKWTIVVGSDSRIFGATKHPDKLLERLRLLKREGALHIMLGIAHLPGNREIRLQYQDGRPLRPLLYVDPNTGLPALTLDELAKLESDRPLIVRWLMSNPDKGSLFDALELRSEHVAPDVSYLWRNSRLKRAYVEGKIDTMQRALLQRHFGFRHNESADTPNDGRAYLGQAYTLVEVTTAFNRSRKLSMVPLLNCIPPARHVFLNSHLNQAIQESTDLFKSHKVQPAHPERAMVVSYVSKIAKMREEELGYGQNVRVAMLDYMGMGCEDGVVVSRSYAERAAINVFETWHSTRRCINKQDEYHRLPRPEEVRHGLPYFNVDRLNPETGTVNVGDEVNDGDVLQVKVVVLQGEDVYRYEESDSLIYKAPYPAVVVSVENRHTKQGPMVEIKTKARRPAEKGDKLSLDRCGQKATISIVEDDSRMPRDSTGHRIDILICPYSLPTRMTASLMHTMLAGSVAARSGERVALGPYFDADAMITRHQNLIDALVAEGEIQKGDIHGNGMEWIYDGLTGARLQNQCMTGTLYVMRIEQLSAPKAGVRAEGPVGENRQPFQGIGGNKGGGSRIGDMEFAALASHGAAFVMQERISDYRRVCVCCNCGRLASCNIETDQWYCEHCPVTARVAWCHFTYAMLSVMWALAGCQMEMRFIPKKLE